MKRHASNLGTFAVLILLTMAASAYADKLLPPGAPAPSMKTLSEIEPRTLIAQTDLPLTISQSGSYYLAADLSFPTTDANAINVTAANVTIDLNGYSLNGPGQSAGTSGWGIYATGQNVTVKNGTVRSFSQGGIRVNYRSRVEDVTVLATGTYGIQAVGDSVISNCIVQLVGSDDSNAFGIRAGHHCIVRGNQVTGVHCNWTSNLIGLSVAGIRCDNDCLVDNNMANSISASLSEAGGESSWYVHGIKTGIGAKVTGNVCSNNSKSGVGTIAVTAIETGEGSAVRENTCVDNAGHGIRTADGCQVLFNVAHSNTATGIFAGPQNTVANNTLRSNGNGIYVGSAGCAVEKNLVAGNSIGISTAGSGSYFASNRASGNTTDYSLGAHTQGAGDLSNISF